MSNTSLGIDVSKLELSIALLQDKKRIKTKFSNDTAGFKKLVQWLKKKKVDNIKICMEATGSYSVGIANFLHGKGYSVYVVNPLCIKSFADSKLSRNKTDEGDAELIAKYILTNEARAYKPHSEIISNLRSFETSLESFKRARAQVKNRLSYVAHLPKELIKFWEATVEHYDKQIGEMEESMAKLITSDKDLQMDYDNLQTIPGIGKTTAITILASIPDIAVFDNARQFAAYVGLTPKQTSSGTSVRGKTRLSKIGSSRLRKAVYYPGIVAKKYNPIVKPFCDNLIKKSKSPMVVLGAAMRKLMHIVFAILKHKCPFNPNIYDTKAAA